MFAYLCTMFFKSSYEIKLKAETITNRTIFSMQNANARPDSPLKVLNDALLDHLIK